MNPLYLTFALKVFWFCSMFSPILSIIRLIGVNSLSAVSSRRLITFFFWRTITNKNNSQFLHFRTLVILGFQGAARTSSNVLWAFPLRKHLKKKKKNLADFLPFISRIKKKLRKPKLMEANFWNSYHPKTFPGRGYARSIWARWFSHFDVYLYFFYCHCPVC